MKRHILGLVGFFTASSLSYILVVLLTSLAAVTLCGDTGTVDFERATTEVAPSKCEIRADLEWHSDEPHSLRHGDQSVSVFGRRYVRATGEHAFVVVHSFRSVGEALEALILMRKLAVAETLFDSATGRTARHTPQHYLRTGARGTGILESETERYAYRTCEHALIWLEGAQIHGVYGRDEDTVRALYDITQQQPN